MSAWPCLAIVFAIARGRRCGRSLVIGFSGPAIRRGWPVLFHFLISLFTMAPIFRVLFAVLRFVWGFTWRMSLLVVFLAVCLYAAGWLLDGYVTYNRQWCGDLLAAHGLLTGGGLACMLFTLIPSGA